MYLTVGFVSDETTVYIAIGLGILVRFRSSILNWPASYLYTI